MKHTGFFFHLKCVIYENDREKMWRIFFVSKLIEKSKIVRPGFFLGRS